MSDEFEDDSWCFPHYGFPIVDDPRQFAPDPDGLEPHELERWARPPNGGLARAMRKSSTGALT